ncbi:MAG: NmrA/HSCARG family protein [Gammaproteobacteria bacterium]|jgi:uncharacterized protein YbjT (DUF2867 family)|nr:NmrA/HSCARG family protein [Gammaproteobacteria bacterium]
MLKSLLACLLLAGLTACATTGSDRSTPILVGGATGTQGGAVVQELLSRGYRVRALTRRPDSPAASRLAALGVEVVQGDYNDAYSLDRALVGVRQMFFYSGRSAGELEEGLNVVAAAQRAGLDHLVYSSGAAAEPGKGLGGPKTQVELAIIASGVPYTVLRPVAFMENFDGQQQRIARRGITDSRAPDRLLHFIAVQDIGLLVGAAFDNPQRWIGQAINIAGDRLTVAEHVEVFSRVMQQPITYHRLSPEALQASLPKPLRPLFAWYETVGYTADVPALRAEFPQMLTLEQYLRATGWEPGEE